MVGCAVLSLVLYRPDWLELVMGLLPQHLKYPAWLPGTYPDIARHSEWVETTRYMGVIGGAGFDYLAYTSWLREKHWGVLPDRATPQKLQEIAGDPRHEVRNWINAPVVDCSISFLVVVVFSAVFVASGAIFLGPAHKVPEESNYLNLQAQFVTGIHPWLLPLYVVGAFLTMLGTLYGTVEIACSIADEIVRTFIADWTPHRAQALRRGVIFWCAAVAFLILGWLYLRQSGGVLPLQNPGQATAAADANEVVVVEKPKRLLAIMTPVNLFTGVLSCGLICVLTVWMDFRWLPEKLRPPLYLTAFNLLAGIIFLALGCKGYWDNEDRILAVGGLVLLGFAAVLIALCLGPMLNPRQPSSSVASGEIVS